METHTHPHCTAFIGTHILASGPLAKVALAVKQASAQNQEPILVFDDTTARVIDLDLRGTDAEILHRLPATHAASQPSHVHAPTPEKRGKGRPKLGVIAREVTLLERHWQWLATQPGGASAVLRRLVEDAKRTGAPKQIMRLAQDNAYRFMSTMAGNLPGFEEATRALFAANAPAFQAILKKWPQDVAAYTTQLAGDAFKKIPSGS